MSSPIKGQAGDFIVCSHDLLAWVGRRSECAGPRGLDPPPGLTVSAVGAPGGGSHQPWMWEGDAWSGTKPRAQDPECSGFELRSSSPRCVSWASRHSLRLGVRVGERVDWPPGL